MTNANAALELRDRIRALATGDAGSLGEYIFAQEMIGLARAYMQEK